jgi:hypothetical protein
VSQEPGQDRAAHIPNPEDRAEYILCMEEAAALTRRATALRKRAWEIYSTRDDKKYA